MKQGLNSLIKFILNCHASSSYLPHSPRSWFRSQGSLGEVFGEDNVVWEMFFSKYSDFHSQNHSTELLYSLLTFSEEHEVEVWIRLEEVLFFRKSGSAGQKGNSALFLGFRALTDCNNHQIITIYNVKGFTSC